MKAVIITKDNEILIRILHRKNGVYEIIKRADVEHLNIEIRDEQWRKTFFPGDETRWK